MSNRKKKPGKGYLQFFLIVLTGAVIGAAGSLILQVCQEEFTHTLHTLSLEFTKLAPWLMIGITIIGCAGNFYMLLKSRRLVREWDGEDEYQAEYTERFIEKSQGIIELGTILALLVNGATLSVFSGNRDMVLHGVGILAFVIYVMCSALVTNQLVECIKKMNPEKQGNALTITFNRDWIKSCDEQEKSRIFAASYKVYINSQFLYGILFIITMFISLVTDVGILPFAIIGIIWGYQIIVYQRSIRKTQNK